MSTTTPTPLEAFERAVAMARAVVIDRTPVAAVATYWGLSEQHLAASIIQHFGELIVEVAKATNAWADLDAMADGLRVTEDDH